MAYLIPKLSYGFPGTTITFTYPPSQDDGEQFDAKEKTTTALNGTRWTFVDYIEVKRKVTLSFLTDSQVEALRTFYLNWASKGEFFAWYDDKDVAQLKNYQLDKNSFTLKKITSNGPTSFLWELTLEMRRVG